MKYKSLVKRVAALVVKEPIKVNAVHFQDDGCGWSTFQGEFVICKKWKPKQLSDWAFVTVIGRTNDNDMVLDDNDNCQTGFYNQRTFKNWADFIFLEECDDRGTVVLTIFSIDR